MQRHKTHLCIFVCLSARLAGQHGVHRHELIGHLGQGHVFKIRRHTCSDQFISLARRVTTDRLGLAQNAGPVQVQQLLLVVGQARAPVSHHIGIQIRAAQIFYQHGSGFGSLQAAACCVRAKIHQLIQQLLLDGFLLE